MSYIYVDDDDQEPRSPNVAKSGDAVTVMRDKYMWFPELPWSLK